MNFSLILIGVWLALAVQRLAHQQPYIDGKCSKFFQPIFQQLRIGQKFWAKRIFCTTPIKVKSETKKSKTANHYTGFKRSCERATQAPASKQTPVHTFRRYATVWGIRNYTETRLILQIQRKQNKYAIVSKKKETGNHNQCTRLCTFEANGEIRNRRTISLLKFNYDRKKKAETSHPTS